MLTFYQYLAVLFPLIFVLIKGYFLSIEFSLYPYLVSSGLLPYKDIVDQHFPAIFFGTFSLPFFLVDSPQKLLLILLGLNFFTTYLLHETLKGLKVAKYQIWTVSFSFLLIFFSANTLWVETFVCFFLVLIFFINTKNTPFYSLFSGVLISQIILLRPTMIIFLSGYFIFIQKNRLYTIFGGLVGFILSLWYLLEKNILDSFYQIVMVFKKEVYAFVQSPTPTTRQAYSLAFLILVFVALSIWKKRIIFVLLGLSTLALIYPRFGLEHLQVFGLCFIYFLSQLNIGSRVVITIHFLVLSVSTLTLLSVLNGVYGNYFYTPGILEVSRQIKQLPDKNIYLYGASDLIYQLAEKLPPNNYYLPSLPWYINYSPFQEKLKKSLQLTNTVIIDPEFKVDGQRLIDATPELLSYIKMNYYLDRKIKHLEIYKLKK